jgi:hypothetical protein
MKRSRLVLSIVFLFIILASLGGIANAQPPMNTQTNVIFAENPALVIEYMKYSAIQLDEPYEYHFHTYNATDGIQLFNDSVSCEGHMYDGKGIRVISLVAEPYVDDTLAVDGFYFNVSGGNFSQLGLFTYHIYCNTSYYGGFATGNIEIVSSGKIPTEAESMVYMGLLFLSLILFIVSVYITISIKGNNSTDYGGIIKVNWNKYIKYFMFYVSYLLLWLLMFFAWQISHLFLTLTLFTNIMRMVYMLLTIGLAPIFIVTFILALLKWLLDLKLNKLAERGLKPR